MRVLQLQQRQQRQRAETVIAESSRATGWMESEQESEKRKVAQVQAEVERVKKLPPCSAYATHRLRVLNKMLDLLSVHPKARTASQAEELELLFAGMSL